MAAEWQNDLKEYWLMIENKTIAYLKLMKEHFRQKKLTIDVDFKEYLLRKTSERYETLKNPKRNFDSFLNYRTNFDFMINLSTEFFVHSLKSK